MFRFTSWATVNSWFRKFIEYQVMGIEGIEVCSPFYEGGRGDLGFSLTLIEAMK